MPDWFYHTVSRPILFRLSADTSRDLALGVMSTLVRLPLGSHLIDFLGHMRADPRLARGLLGRTIPTPLGIGSGLDTRAVALPALARFGVGFLEIGPVSLEGSAGAAPLQRLADRLAIWCPDPPSSLALPEALVRLRQARRCGVALVTRVAATSTTVEKATLEIEQVAAALCETTDAVVLMTLATAVEQNWSIDDWLTHFRKVRAAVLGTKTPSALFVAVPADLDHCVVGTYVGATVGQGIVGVLVDGSVRAEPGGRIYGLPALPPTLEQVRHVHQRWPGLVLIGSGGIHEPAHALEMLQAGADLISADTGLIFTGPGLPKRINEAILYATQPDAEPPAASEASPLLPREPDRATERSWFWTTLMGAGMLLGSLLALLIAATVVVLPYDEAFVGMSRDQLRELNPRLLSFLAHDRVSLAGTMVAIGVTYVGLSLFGVRRGLHWAQMSVFASAFAGFATFFLFLGYGYLDPLHAFVTAILFQFLLLGMHCRLGPAPVPDRPQLVGDRAWKLAQWGQLLLIGHGVAVLTAGVVICGVGVTHVFVPEDLAFMQTTAETLREANPRLVPMVAHDRATFGGMLVSSGLALLLPALWGYRPGTAWLWWTQMLAVVPAYAAAIGVHLAVGYTDLMHLTPAYGGLGVFLLGQALTRGHLCRPGATAEEWQRYRGRCQRSARPGLNPPTRSSNLA